MCDRSEDGVAFAKLLVNWIYHYIHRQSALYSDSGKYSLASEDFTPPPTSSVQIVKVELGDAVFKSAGITKVCGNRIRILEQAINLGNICVCMFSGRVYVNHRERGKAETNEISVCVCDKKKTFIKVLVNKFPFSATVMVESV